MTDKASILIVDDRPEKVLALEAVLEDLNQHIVRAYSGREALRHVLHQEFAVILLDVNMPGMDGFETAQLIRQRKSSEHTPIIFITSFGDEMHAARGYSLGAVDYILAPVLPDVLRTKVNVFVDLFRKTQQLHRQTDWLRHRAEQLQKLAAASVSINAAISTEKMLQTITDAARDVVGSHQAITLCIPPAIAAGHRPGQAIAVGSFSDRYAEWQQRPLRLDEITNTLVARSKTPTRMTEAELRDHPDYEIVRRMEIPPIRGGMLAAPLHGRDGASLGVIYLAERIVGNFTTDDQAVLVQLAQMAGIAIENTLYSLEREANRAKDEFLATLSHELRTPLNAMLGWTQLLRSEPDLDAEVTHGLEVIERNVRAQTKLVEDLLDVSRITSGKLRLSTRPLLPQTVVEAAIDAVRPAAESKQIRIHATLAPTRQVLGDPDRLQQVVWNLLTNAVKFTPRGGRVTVSLEDGDGNGAPIVIRITDNGSGIHPDFLPHVFDRFRQADSSSTRSHGGLGIGLTIVRHIIQLHGGAVEAHSAGEHHGATFTVRLPCRASGAERDPALEPDRPAVLATLPQTPVVEGHRLNGVSVLLVDDDGDALELVAEVLRRSGAAVTACASAQEALGVLMRTPPDVLLSDVAMPDTDGYALIRSIRALSPEEGGAVPAIALTAYARHEDRQAALAAGFQEHLAKPVEPAELTAAIARLTAPAPAPARIGCG